MSRKRKNRHMRVDPSFKKLVDRMGKDISRVTGENFTTTKTTRLISETYPESSIMKLVRRKKINLDDDELFENLLSF